MPSLIMKRAVLLSLTVRYGMAATTHRTSRILLLRMRHTFASPLLTVNTDAV